MVTAQKLPQGNKLACQLPCLHCVKQAKSQPPVHLSWPTYWQSATGSRGYRLAALALQRRRMCEGAAVSACDWGTYSSAESEHAGAGRHRRRRIWYTKQSCNPELASGRGRWGYGSARAPGRPGRGGIWGGWHRGWHPPLVSKFEGKRRRRRKEEAEVGREEEKEPHWTEQKKQALHSESRLTTLLQKQTSTSRIQTVFSSSTHPTVTNW